MGKSRGGRHGAKLAEGQTTYAEPAMAAARRRRVAAAMRRQAGDRDDEISCVGAWLVSLLVRGAMAIEAGVCLLEACAHHWPKQEKINGARTSLKFKSMLGSFHEQLKASGGGHPFGPGLSIQTPAPRGRRNTRGRTQDLGSPGGPRKPAQASTTASARRRFRFLGPSVARPSAPSRGSGKYVNTLRFFGSGLF